LVHSNEKAELAKKLSEILDAVNYPHPSEKEVFER
jgi:hypothetical protein